MNPSVASRMVEAAKGKLLQYVSDVYIYTDHYKGNDAGLSPGYGLSLRAETTTGCFLSYEQMGESGLVPEELAATCAQQLLFEILRVIKNTSMSYCIGWMCRHFKPSFGSCVYGNGS